MAKKKVKKGGKKSSGDDGSEEYDFIAEKNARLSEKRTELAYERTVLAYIRTAATVILFGVAFFGLSDVKWDFFFYSGVIAVSVGILLLIAAIISGVKHMHELMKIKSFFARLVHFDFMKGKNE